MSDLLPEDEHDKDGAIDDLLVRVAELKAEANEYRAILETLTRRLRGLTAKELPISVLRLLPRDLDSVLDDRARREKYLKEQVEALRVTVERRASRRVKVARERMKRLKARR